ncbi:hypothetical protein HEP87_61650 [Streptomyces sp. S1D4-11]
MTTATYLRTNTIPVDQLTPYPGNAKRGDVPAILRSLRKNGQYRGLVVRQQPDGTLVVLAGNHTRMALAEHGPGDCGVKECGLCHNSPAWTPAVPSPWSTPWEWAVASSTAPGSCACPCWPTPARPVPSCAPATGSTGSPTPAAPRTGGCGSCSTPPSAPGSPSRRTTCWCPT